MKFRRSQKFKDDFDKLPDQVKEKAKEKFRLFQQKPLPPQHPSLRIKKMRGHENIWEGHVTMQHVFTFEWIEDDEQDEIIVLFRRIGTHKIYDNP